jgi:glucose-1-phosphate adenylyltransferase
MLDRTLAIVLAGGRGSRLKPLTNERAKAAVPFGGKYRIIDFTLANCLHSGLRQVLVLTQYKSHSLQKHLRDGWYAGNADAVHQNRYLIERSGAQWTLILSGDHIYRMDYAAMLAFHRDHGADATVAGMEVPAEQASGFAMMSLDEDERIAKLTQALQQPVSPPEDHTHSLVSMEVYLFSTELLLEYLTKDSIIEDSSHDFGNDILPALVRDRSAFAYRFGGTAGRVSIDRYWRNIQTLDNFYQTNMDLLQPVPPLDLYQADWPIRTYQGQHPPARTVPGISNNEGIFINSIVGDGVIIAGGGVQQSILFPRVCVGDEAVVEESILFEKVSVANGARLKRCIIDKEVRIPPGETVGYELEKDRSRFTVTEEGVVVVPRGYRFN